MLSKKLIVIMVAVIMVVALGCSRGNKSDAEIASEVQNKINTDNGLTKPEVTVGTVEGVVTLSGRVTNESDKAAAANDATQIAGVKSVVNNLEVMESAELPKPVGTRSARTPSTPRSHPAPAAGPSSDRARATPEEQPITISEGTEISARMVDSLDSGKAKQGDTFQATLESPITSGSMVVIPKYAELEGQVVTAKDAAHFAGSSELSLVLTKVQVGNNVYAIQTDAYSKKGAGRGKRTAEVVGGGAGAGALIGGLTHGTKGALIGAAIGAGAGTGVQAVTHGEQVKIPSETVLQFQLTSPLIVKPAGR